MLWATQARALLLLQVYYSTPRPAHAAADMAALFQVALPRLLAAASAPEPTVRDAAVLALPSLDAAAVPHPRVRSSSSYHPPLTPAHLAALAAGISKQRAHIEADAAALPAALRYTLQHCGNPSRAATDDRCTLQSPSPVAVASGTEAIL